MHTRKPHRAEAYLFPERLLRQLDKMPDYALTVVEAPSGFGKTTAVREYLNKRAAHGAQRWYTCLGETPPRAWEGICALFDPLDRAVAAHLRRLDLPTRDTLSVLVSLLRTLRCAYEQFLVIDNFQLIGTEIPRQLISALSAHGNPFLHIVILSQPLRDSAHTSVHHTNIHTIRDSDLLFDALSTAAYSRMAGLPLADSELDSLHRSAEGWIAAIRLQILRYQQAGTFTRTADIDQLVRSAVWNQLSADEQEFLLSVCILNSFTLKQARILCGEAGLSEDIFHLIEDSAFIRYDPEREVYVIHSILQEYLRSRFYHHQPEDFQARVVRRAGEACAAVGDYFAAALFYQKLPDFEAILSLPFPTFYLNNQEETDVLSFITRVVNDCPEDILMRHPMMCIRFAFHLLMSGQREVYGKLCRLLEQIITQAETMPAQERSRIQGEFALLTSFKSYNDIQKMSEGHRAALSHLDGPSVFVLPSSPWTFMNVSVLNMFWSKSGELDTALALMDRCVPLYSRLACGHGTGADVIMRAESLLMRGMDKDAESLCHQALYLSGRENQTGLCLCAKLVLARIALLRGDAAAYEAVLGQIRALAAACPRRFLLRMAELCTASLALTLDETDTLPDWLCDLERMQYVLYLMAMPYGHILYGRLLLLQKRYQELYGLSGLMLGMAQGMHYLLPQVYHLLHLAAAQHAQGQMQKARENLQAALTIALPDRVLLPFAELGGSLRPLLEAETHQAGMDAVLALCKRQAAGMDAVRRALAPERCILTPREREIALLAKKRLTAREIAEQLFISDSTVRSALKTIYSKLGIHAKAQLSEKDF